MLDFGVFIKHRLLFLSMSHTSVIHTSPPGSRKKMSLLIVLSALCTPSGWNRSKDRFVKWTELKGKVCFWNKLSLST